ncbi:hypothetical protein BDY24DRAFT_411045 [Mrakia frigida]|uniref:uncharacterized protein n=1 Tax=Mrakia frigida TaxID=29902 RepID=UPI003FCC11A1
MAAAVQHQQQATPQKRSESFSLLSTPSSSSSTSRPSPLRSSSPPSTPSSNPPPQPSSSKPMTTGPAPSSSSSGISRSQSTVAFTQKVPISVEGALAGAEGDPLAALEQVVAQRNKLLEENDGLWKMVQNLRDKADTHRADAARYRSERDRALSSTRSSRGGSPGPISAMSGSASAIGLGLAESSSASNGGSRPPRSFSGGTSTLLAYPGVGKRQNSEGDGSRSVSGASSGRKDKERFGEGAGGSSSSSSPRVPPDEVRSDERKQQLEDPPRQSISSVTKPTTPTSINFKNDPISQPSPPPSPHPMPNSQRAPSTTPLPSSSTFSPGPTAPLRLNQRPPPPPSPTTATSVSAPSSPPNASDPNFASVNSFTFPSTSSSTPARGGPPPSSFAPGQSLGEPKQSRRQQVAESTLEFPPEISQYLASLGDSPKTVSSPLPEEAVAPSLAPSPVITDTPSKPPSPAYVLSVSSPGSSSSSSSAVPSIVPRRRSSVPTNPPTTPSSQVPGLSTTPSPSASTTSTLPQLTPMSPFFQHSNSPNVTPGGSRSKNEEGGAIVDVAGREDDDEEPEPRAPSKDGRELQKQQQAALRAAGLGATTEKGARVGQEVYPNEQKEEDDARTPNPSRMAPPSQPISTTPLYSPSGHSSMRDAQARGPGPLQYREEDPRQRQQQHQGPQSFQGQQQQQQQPQYHPSQQQQQQAYAQQQYQQQQQNHQGQQHQHQGNSSSRPFQPPPQQQQQQPGYPMYQPPQPPRSPVYAAFGPGGAQPPSTPRGPSSDHLPTSPPPPLTPRGPPPQQQQQQPTAPTPYHQSQPIQAPQSRGPLLQSAALPFTSLSIHSCAVVTNDSNREVIRFRIAVTITPPASTGRQVPSSHWKVDKLFSDFLALDGSVRGKIGRKEAKQRGIVSLPEAKAWKDVAMGKLDQRKKLLETYLNSILEATLPEKDDFCWFLSTGVVPNEIAAQQIITKEGMLLKRGQKFGGWKKRFFALGGLGRPVMDYFDGKGGTHIGSIPLAGAQIGRSKEAADGGDPHQRHAFLIIEALTNGGKGTRHVLCAETDEERDEWVDILVLYTTGKYTRASSPANRAGGATSPPPPLLPRSSTSSSIQSVVASYNSNSASGRKPSIRKLSKDDIVIGSAQPLSKLSQEESSPKFASVAVSLIDATSSSSPFRVLDSPRNEHLRRQQQQHNPKAGSASTLHDIASSGSLPNLEQASRGGGPRHVPSSSEMVGQYADVDESAPPSSSSSGVPARLSTQQQHRQSAMPPSRLGPSSNGKNSNLSLSTIPPYAHQQKQGGSPSMSSNSIPEERNGAVSPDKVVGPTERIQASKISGPQGGAPIPAGFKFGAKDEVPERDRKAKSGRWGFGFGKMAGSASANPLPQSRPVFGVPLSESLGVAKIAELPAVVYRCIEYLEAKHAELEEGIYRLSGSSAVIKGLRDRFNNEGDIDLLKEGETWDPHAICGVLKGFLRELTTSLLTRELHMRFLAVIDLVDSDERVKELRHLVGELPLPNYSLLRALTAHLILIVENAATNKMTLRNVGIVFSPTLGIPAGVFSELVLHFQNVFDDVSVGDEDQATSEVDEAGELDRKQSKRNSVSFLGTETLLGLGGRKLSPVDPETNVDEEGSIDDSATDDDASQGEEHPSSSTGNFRDRDNDPTIRMTPPATGLTIPAEFMGGTELTYTRPAVSAGLPLSPRPGPHQSNSPGHSPTS